MLSFYKNEVIILAVRNAIAIRPQQTAYKHFAGEFFFLRDVDSGLEKFEGDMQMWGTVAYEWAAVATSGVCVCVCVLVWHADE